MKDLRKKILSALLTAALLTTAMPYAAYAQSASDEYDAITDPAGKISDNNVNIVYEPAKEKRGGIQIAEPPVVIDGTENTVLFDDEQKPEIIKGTFDESAPGYGSQFEEGSLPDLAYKAFEERKFSEEEMDSGSAEITVDISSLGLTQDDINIDTISIACNVFFYDHPESEYFSFKTVSMMSRGDGICTEVIYDVYFLKNCKERIKNFNEGISDFKSQFDYSADAVDQYKNIQDYISSHTAYNHEYLQDETGYREKHPDVLPYNAYGLLADHDKVVCESYAKSYKALCDAVGLPCVFVAGYSAQEPGQFSSIDHAWNYIKIDGKWYAIDCTWDDYDKNKTIDGETCYTSLTIYRYFCNNKYFTGDSSADHKAGSTFTENSPYEFDLPKLITGTDRPGKDFQITDICLTPVDSETSGNFIKYMVNCKKYYRGTFILGGYELGRYIKNTELNIKQDTKITADDIVIPEGSTLKINSADADVHDLMFSTDGVAVTAEPGAAFEWDNVNIIGRDGANESAPTINIKNGASYTRGTRAGLNGFLLDENTKYIQTSPSDTASGVWCMYAADLRKSNVVEINMNGRSVDSIAAFQAEYDENNKMISIRKLQLAADADGTTASVSLTVPDAGSVDAAALYITDTKGGAPLTGKIVWDN